MSLLFDLQNEFQQHLLQSDDAIYHAIISTDQVPADIRLAIYSNAYRWRLLDALAANYPMLQIYVGDEEFEKLAFAYIDAHPSPYRSIRWFGDQLENFLSEHADYSALPCLAELARIEWTMTLVFDSADSQSIDLEMMGKIPPEAWAEMRLKFHPSTRLIHLSWNVIPIWKALTHDQSPPELTKNDSPIHWLFWRKDLVNHFCSLTADEAYAINSLLQGLTFGDVCEGLCQWMDEDNAGVRAASLLKGWIVNDMIVKIL